MKAGKENGLMFMVDTNSERSFEIVDDEEKSLTYQTLRLGEGVENGLAQIHINTLASFYGEGPGDYAISSLKKMTGTKNFLALPDNEKGCQIEDFVECKRRNYFTTGKLICGDCLPWILQRVHGNTKVRSHYNLFNKIVSQNFFPGPELFSC